MKKINFLLKNNEVILINEEINYIDKDNKILFIVNNENYTVYINENKIVKENDENIITLNFADKYIIIKLKENDLEFTMNMIESIIQNNDQKLIFEYTFESDDIEKNIIEITYK